ncbi:MAG: AIR synthase-related protein, partial [Luteitalea sp.]
EKLLLEACLEVLQTGALVGLQDMGAAGLSCATSEMSARGQLGMDVEVTLVPQRETGMTPYEIMLSESQERMLFVVHAGREAIVERIFEKWDLHAVRIGQVTANGRVVVRERGTVVADVPARALADEAPLYDRPAIRPEWLDDRQRLDASHFGVFPDAIAVLRRLLATPSIASKRWIYRQYDHMVRTNTLCLAGQGTPVVRVKGTHRGLAMSLDGNGRYGQTDPRRGAMLAVAEAARNVACAGAVPIGASNNLNFGNPERPEIMWQFVQAVEGIGEACRAFGIPITGGNVSLYNETAGQAIYPTPVLGVVGLVEDVSTVIGQAFPSDGLKIVLLGETRGELGASEYLHQIHGQVRGLPPALDLSLEHALQVLLPALIQGRLVASAHDCSEGGLAVTLAECTFGEAVAVGATVDLESVPGIAGVPAAHATLFSESAGRVVLGVAPEHVAEVLDRSSAAGVACRVIGSTGSARLVVRIDGQDALVAPVDELQQIWSGALEQALATPQR